VKEKMEKISIQILEMKHVFSDEESNRIHLALEKKHLYQRSTSPLIDLIGTLDARIKRGKINTKTKNRLVQISEHLVMLYMTL
jgi:hypothetical protein